MEKIKIKQLRSKGFKIYDKKGNQLGEEYSLMEALAFAKGLIRQNSDENPFEPAGNHEFNEINLEISLPTAIGILNGVRSLQPMAISDFDRIKNAFKQGCLVESKN